MKRLFYIFILAYSCLSFSTGCRMCCSNDDYCIPAFINRQNDFRGCGPVYRAGSIYLNTADCRSCAAGQAVSAQTSNAGHWGNVLPITSIKPRGFTGTNRPGIDLPPAVGPKTPIDVDINNPFEGPPLPTIEDIINKQPDDGKNPPKPITAPKTDSPPPDDKLPEMIPFVESDTLPPARNNYTDITVDELKKLEPSAAEIRILKVEDRAL